MIIPFEFSQRPINIGNHTEQWRIRKSGLTFTSVRNDETLETGDARQAVAFFTAGRGQPEVTEAAQQLVGTVDATLGGWPAERPVAEAIDDAACGLAENAKTTRLV